MSKREDWIYRNGKLVEKRTIENRSDGSTRTIRQKAHDTGIRRVATTTTSETISKPGRRT